MADPNLRPKSLDAFLELQHTNQILAGEISDLKQQAEKIKSEYTKKKKEKEILREEWQKEITNKEEKYEKIPEVLSPVKPMIMNLVYSEKETQYIELVNSFHTLASSSLLRQDGLSFCLTKYKTQTYSEAQACIYAEGFSIIQATINLLTWKEEIRTGNIVITRNALFEHGLLKKLIISKSKQLQGLTHFPWKLKHIINSMMESYPKHFVVLEIQSAPPHFQDYPAPAQHYIRIDVVHHGKPKTHEWDTNFYHVQIPTEERIMRWRAYSLTVAPKKFTLSI